MYPNTALQLQLGLSIANNIYKYTNKIMMRNGRIIMHIIFRLSVLIPIIPFACGWGYDGHVAVCRIAQARLNKVAAEAVRKLLPPSAKGDLGILCPWPDQIRMRYPWSSSLHFVNTPDNLCSYKYNRDCKDRNGVKGRCVAGAINNFTTQLLSYKKPRSNLTEALIFLSHFMGDIHQPLHVGFISDKGGNTIKVNWFGKKQVALHRVWDSEIIIRAEGGSNPSNLNKFIESIQHKIKSQWANQVSKWEPCCCNQKACPNIYAAESIKAACHWAYKGVRSGSTVKVDYFTTRLPVVELRLAQAGVRLAATLNRIFKRYPH